MILKTKKLGEVVSIITGKLDANAAIGDGEFPFYTCSKENSQINETAFDGESILLSGNGEFWVKYHESGKFNAYQRVYVIKTEKSDIFLRYVYYFMVVEIPKLTSQGAVIKYLRLPQLQNLEIPLPPLEEQKRIVKILDKKIGKIKEAIKLREEAIANTEKILSRTLSEIFAEGNKKGWQEKEIKDICEHPQYGFTASSSQNKIGPKMLRITDIQDGIVNWDTVPYCKCDDVEKYQLKKDDIVFARTGATVGKSFLIKDEPKNSVYASYLIRLRAKRGALAEFLYYFFQSANYWDQVNEQAVGGAQPNVNGTKLARLNLFLPEISEQKQIVQKLDSLSEKIKELKELQTAQLSNLKRLEKSLLREAFNGEL
ncbi:MAG: type restriction enzyme subunit [Patescibacteria group bacterium]|nr:type restriction enzyme subunit [Patescibacteria group bacterium]